MYSTLDSYSQHTTSTAGSSSLNSWIAKKFLEVVWEDPNAIGNLGHWRTILRWKEVFSFLLSNFVGLTLLVAFLRYSPSLTYLLSWVWGQVEYEHWEEWNAHAGDDDVDRVKEGFSPQLQVEENVRVRLLAAGIVLFVAHSRYGHHVPFGRDVVLLQIHTQRNGVISSPLIDMSEINLDQSIKYQNKYWTKKGNVWSVDEDM